MAYTDGFAHDGNYGLYLEELHAFDAMIEDLWSYIQSDNGYKNKTPMLVTVDHGRGYGDDWTSHGSAIMHSKSGLPDWPRQRSTRRNKNSRRFVSMPVRTNDG